MSRFILKDLVDIYLGVTHTPEYVTKGVPFLSVKDISGGQIRFADCKHISQEEYESLSEGAKPKVGDMLFCRVGTIGKPIIIPKGTPLFGSFVSLGYLRNKDSTKCDLRYIKYWMNSNSFSQQVNANVRGASQVNLNTGWLSRFYLDVPIINEQILRINLLDKVYSIIDNRKQQLQSLDDLIKARFVEMFGESGKQVLLSDYVWFQEGPGVRSVDFKKSGTVLLTGSNINKNTISFGYKSDRFISSELAQGKYAHFMCDKDDILVVSSAIDPNRFDEKVTIVQEDKKYCLNTGIIRFKPNRDYLTLGYFREFLKTDYFKHQVMEEMRGIAQMHFGPSHLKKMTILLPNSIEKQIEFENFVTQIDKSKVVVQKALDEAQLLFDSLMQKYFG